MLAKEILFKKNKEEKVVNLCSDFTAKKTLSVHLDLSMNKEPKHLIRC